MRRIKSIEKLYHRAINSYDEYARITGRKGGQGPIVDKYELFFHYDHLVLAHYETITLIIDDRNRLAYWYGESQSDANSMNTILDILNIPGNFVYRPVNGGFNYIHPGNE